MRHILKISQLLLIPALAAEMKFAQACSDAIYRRLWRATFFPYTVRITVLLIILFIIKIVDEVQQEKLKYTKETEQYTALGYQSLSTNAVNSSGNFIIIIIIA